MEPRAFARSQRQQMTDAERVLWRHLRAHRMNGHKFRRQQPIGPYVVDFVSMGAHLVVEADGGQHATRGADVGRDTWLRSRGFTVLRFWNDDILLRTPQVLEAIWLALETPPLPHPSPARGEGLAVAPLHRAGASQGNGPAFTPSPLVGEGGGEG
jgi:very-short-patch-repair endonuclease